MFHFLHDGPEFRSSAMNKGAEQFFAAFLITVHVVLFSICSGPSLYRASPIAALLLRGIFYSAFFTVNPDWLRDFTVV